MEVWDSHVRVVVAKQRHPTVSRALVVLAEKGVEAEAAARKGLDILTSGLSRRRIRTERTTRVRI